MKFAVIALVAFSSLAASGAAYANADDTKWVAQCVSDNSDAKVDVTVITKYCTCMNGKMDENETKTITQWEKSHPTERDACSKQAGWN
jgi:hypothetical protein